MCWCWLWCSASVSYTHLDVYKRQAQDDARLPPPVDDATVQMVLEKIRNAKRPVFHAGYGLSLIHI